MHSPILVILALVLLLMPLQAFASHNFSVVTAFSDSTRLEPNVPSEITFEVSFRGGGKLGSFTILLDPTFVDTTVTEITQGNWGCNLVSNKLACKANTHFDKLASGETIFVSIGTKPTESGSFKLQVKAFHGINFSNPIRTDIHPVIRVGSESEPQLLAVRVIWRGMDIVNLSRIEVIFPVEADLSKAVVTQAFIRVGPNVGLSSVSDNVLQYQLISKNATMDYEWEEQWLTISNISTTVELTPANMKVRAVGNQILGAETIPDPELEIVKVIAF